MIFVLALVHLGYTLCYWGSTLIGGGPGGTGSWPFLYTMTGLGPGPLPAGPGQGGTTGGGGGNAIPAGPGSLGLPAIPGITTGIGVYYCTGALTPLPAPPVSGTPSNPFAPVQGGQPQPGIGPRLPAATVQQICMDRLTGRIPRDCVRSYGYDCQAAQG